MRPVANLRKGTTPIRFIPLRYRFIFITTGTLILILTALAVLISVRQARNIRQKLEQRGISIAQSLAAASVADLLTYNYVALDRSAHQAAQGTDIVYVIFHDKEGRVAGFSNRSDLQHQFLDDAISRDILAGASPLVHEVSLDNSSGPGLDIAIPVYPPGQKGKWGTVRVCLSMAPMQRQIRQTQLTIIITGVAALITGILLSIWAARRITQPLAELVRGTQKAAKGDLDQHIDVKTGDEVEVLASNFAVMIKEIQAHRRELEQQLIQIKRLQTYTDQLLTTMADGLLSIQFSGVVSAINPAAETLLKGDGTSIRKGDHIDDAFVHFAELKQYIRRVLADPKQCQPQEMYRQSTDRQQVLLVDASVLKDRDGKPREAIINLHDITGLKQLEASMRQSERLAALGTLAAGMAHEIRNPLSTIKTFVQLLPRKIERQDFRSKFQRTVPRELNRINQLVQELLELSRVPKYQFKKIQIDEVLDQTVELVKNEIDASHIDCQYELALDLPPIRADANQLFKAFYNIMNNAVEAMPDGGRLSVKGYCNNEQPYVADQVRNEDVLTLTFHDTGIGIEPESIQQIFNPFYTTKDSGTGLGLAIAHKVITEHGGQIDVSSQIGKGTRFRIRLPALTP